MFVIDFESSGLGHNSYPIQVAVCNQSESYSAYIRPEEDWNDWCMAAQDVHNIPRSLLFDVGLPAKQVAKELNEFIGNEIAYCDGGIYDIQWGNELYRAVKMDKSWYYGDVVSYALQGQERSVIRAVGLPWSVFKQKIAKQLNLREHDALNDAKIIRLAAVKLQNDF